MKIAYALLLTACMTGSVTSPAGDDVYVGASSVRESYKLISRASSSEHNYDMIDALELTSACQSDPSIDAVPYYPSYEVNISHDLGAMTPILACGIHSFTTYIPAFPNLYNDNIPFDGFPHLAIPKGRLQKGISTISLNTRFLWQHFQSDPLLPHAPISMKESVQHSINRTLLFADHVIDRPISQTLAFAIEAVDCPFKLVEIEQVSIKKYALKKTCYSCVVDLPTGVLIAMHDSQLPPGPHPSAQPCKPRFLTPNFGLLHLAYDNADADYLIHTFVIDDVLTDLLYSPSIYRILSPCSTSFRASNIPMPIRALPLAAADQELMSQAIPMAQLTGIDEQPSSQQTKSLILEPLPLTIQLPTLAQEQFVLETEPFSLHQECVAFDMQKISFRYFPSFTRIATGDKRSKRYSKGNDKKYGSHFPRSIPDVYPEWVNQKTHIPSIVLEHHAFSIQPFHFDGVPDLRSFMLRTAPLACASPIPKRVFCSALIPPAETTEVVKKPPEKPLITHGYKPLPEHSVELYVVAKRGSFSIEWQINSPANPPKFCLDSLEAVENLIPAEPVMHLSSQYSLKSQVHTALLSDAKQKRSTRKRLAQDRVLAPYGEFPEHESNEISVNNILTHSELILEPLPSASPYLWPDLECPDDVMTKTYFTLDQHASKSHSVNRGHRVTAANLACIPSLRDLHTASLDQEFSTEISWAPQAKGERYVFTLKLKPINPSYFERIPQNVHFVLDNTNPIQKNKLAAYKSAILRALPYVHSEDRFNVYALGDELSAMSNAPISANSTSKSTTRSFLSRLKLYRAYNDANSYKLLTKLSDQLQSLPGMHTVFLFTNGSSLADMPKKFKSARELVLMSRMNVYPVSVAGDNDLVYLQMLAKLQRGSVFHTPNFASFPRKFAAFVKKHQNPIVSDLHAVATPAEAGVKMKLFNESPRIPPLYSGHEIVLHGEMDKLCDFHLMLQGKFGTKWVNVNKKLSFGLQSSMDIGLHETIRREAAAAYINDYLVNENGKSLYNANQLLYR